MSRGVFGALKDAVLILDEIKRLNENIRRLFERVERLETRVVVLEREKAVSDARETALIAKFEAATRAAAAEAHLHMIERIIRLEQAAAKSMRIAPRLAPDDPSDRTP